ncbi:MAG: DNA-binding response regulator [Candidatus Tectomicrobia bacterium]|nr:DNA-binding response regulator [Candidatus Tectomicrobia bacterium]
MAPKNGSSPGSVGQPPAKLLLAARGEDAAVRELRGVLREAGYEVLEASCTEVAINALDEEALAAMITELRGANLDGMRLLEVAKRRNPEVCAIMLLAGQQDLELASEAMRQGADDFQLRPFHYPKLLAVLRRGLEHQHLVCENSTLQRRLYRNYGVEAITGSRANSADLGVMVGMTLEEVERLMIERILASLHGDKPAAAGMLGIGLGTLYRKLDRYQQLAGAQVASS